MYPICLCTPAIASSLWPSNTDFPAFRIVVAVAIAFQIRFPIPKQAQVPRAPIQPYARFTSEGTGIPRTPNFRTPDDRSVVATDDDGRWRMLQKKIPYSSAPVASVDHAEQERTLERMQATQHNLDSVLSASHRADGSRHDLTASLAEQSAASTRSHRQHRSFSSAAEAMAEYDAASGHVAALATVESPRKTRKLAEQNLALQPRVHYVPDLEDGRGSSRGNWFYGHTQRLQLHTDLAVREKPTMCIFVVSAPMPPVLPPGSERVFSPWLLPDRCRTTQRLKRSLFQCKRTAGTTGSSSPAHEQRHPMLAQGDMRNLYPNHAGPSLPVRAQRLPRMGASLCDARQLHGSQNGGRELIIGLTTGFTTAQLSCPPPSRYMARAAQCDTADEAMPLTLRYKLCCRPCSPECFSTGMEVAKLGNFRVFMCV